MKKNIKSLTVSILLTLLLPSLSMGESIKISNGEVSSDTAGGNGEVLSKKNHFKDVNDFKVDMKNLYTKASIGLKFIERVLKAVDGRSGEGYTTTGDINKTIDYLIIHAKLAEGEYPISSNLQEVEAIQDKKEFTLHIPASKMVKDTITIYNQKGEILIEYNIIK